MSYKRGWPDDKDRAQAIDETVEEVRKLYPGREIVSTPEIIQTPEHEENGEYLVKILVL